MIYLRILRKYIISAYLRVKKMDFVYRFPVVRGIQAKREYYIAMVPLKMIPRIPIIIINE